MEQLAHFRILSKMGAGGMGEVYRARDEKLQRDVAIKVVPESQFSDATAKARLFREARAAAGLSHPNICVVHEVGEAGGKAYIAMECVEGETLGARMAREPLSHSEVLRFALQLADALAHAHERGVVHRDLKPANVIVTPEQRLKVLDFGLARRVDERSSDSLSSTDIMVTQRGVICGTPAYMSPEQLRGSAADERSDIWALGVILHEMLSRERPFEGRTWPELSAAILSMAPRPLPDRVSTEVKTIIARCLEKEPSRRYQRASEVRSALEVLDSRVISSPAVAREKPGKRKPAEASAARTRVAVLPFVNLTADPENAYLADGITEDLMTEISKVGSLTVVSRTSVMQFRERPQSVKEIAKALRSDVVVEGSVRRAGERVRIAARVINGHTDEQVWADAFERDLTDIFAIQKDVALHVAAALSPELSSSERARVGQPATNDAEAYQLYLQGKHCLNRLTEEGLRNALEYFERAAARDPAYAQPHAGIANAYMLIGDGHGAGGVPQREAYPRARAAIDRALTIDSSLGEAHAIDAILKFMFEYDWEGAEKAFLKAIALSPENAWTLDGYAVLLSALERYDEALAAQRQAHDLDPLSPVVMSDTASTLLRAGRYDEALKQAAMLIAIEPAFPLAHSTMGWAYVKQGRFEEGLEALEKAVRMSPGNTMLLAQLGQAYAIEGQTDRAREILDRLLALGRERYVSPYHLAYIYTGLGEFNIAIDCLERAVEERAGGVYGIRGSFLFTELRSHPRFIALLRKMNLA